MKGYFTLSQLFDRTTLSPVERQVVLLSVSFANGCRYCMAAHSALAQRAEMPDDALQALRTGDPIPGGRLEALRRLTRALVEKHGRPDTEDFEPFFAAGFRRHQVFEAILGVGMKTLSNCTNHIAGTPLDQAFAGQQWSPPEGTAAPGSAATPGAERAHSGTDSHPRGRGPAAGLWMGARLV